MLKGTPNDPRQLTPKGLEILLGWIKRIPHDLATAARAAGYRPHDVLTWYWGGMTDGCPHALWVELAFEVAQIRAAKAAQNHRRIVRAAKGGYKRTERRDGNGEVLERKLEEVPPAEWAIKALDNRAEQSAWSTFPGRDVMDQLRELAEALPVTGPEPAFEPPEPPLLPASPDVDDEPLE
jgi:hypothetical protein